MKKTFRLTEPRLDDARVRDKIRHEVNKYVKRERRKELTEGHERWDFNCRVGAAENSAAPLPLGEVAMAIDRVAADGAAKVYVEIVARARRRSEASA